MLFYFASIQSSIHFLLCISFYNYIEFLELKDQLMEKESVLAKINQEYKELEDYQVSCIKHFLSIKLFFFSYSSSLLLGTS